MSSAGLSGGGGGGDGRRYFCYQCEQHVSVAPPSSPTAELFCPICNGTFLEESETAAPANPIPNPFLTDSFPASAAFGGLPIVFPSASGAPGGAAFTLSSGAEAVGLDDPSMLFGSRSPNEFNPFAFLNSYISGLQARGANIQLVFESPGGDGGLVGGAADFRLPPNLGDYFIGPGFEQLIQQLAENDPNRYGTPPASKSAVEGLPDIKITKEILDSDSSQCAVCKDSFELDEEAKQMPCKHIYHKDCILPWLELHNSCPVCRYELPTDDQDYENQRTGQSNDNSTRSIESRNLGFGTVVGNQENRDGNSPSPRMVERRFRVSLPFPWMWRGMGSPAETSAGGGATGSDGGNNSANNNNNGNNTGGSDAAGSGAGRGQAREEDLD
ncbi:E3 ubiquitin-protein ligase RING1-like [Andrographis paniculata]|uniref:E3 ubiquitin-protein ligase RING1-like n=1 Tax=Andrographis paniculata TaxID=175694 RepID=UPI0021E92591|nr:E3 ubiquitin-protein ligase RING1-like [Andrographis paniculata]